jgi:hypothetical protein
MTIGDAPLAPVLFLRSQASATATFHVLCQFAHRFPRDDSSLAPRKGRFGLVDRCQDPSRLRSRSTHQGQRLPHGAFGIANPTGRDGAANKFLLLSGEFYSHEDHPAFSRRAASTAA